MKINIIDLLIGLFVIAAVGFGFMKLSSEEGLLYKEQESDFIMEVLQKRVYKEVIEEIGIGDEIYDSTSNKYLGVLTDKVVTPSYNEVEVDGKLVKADVEDYFDVIYTIEGEGVYHAEKGMKIGGQMRFIGYPIDIKSNLAAGTCYIVGLEIDKEK